MGDAVAHLLKAHVWVGTCQFQPMMMMMMMMISLSFLSSDICGYVAIVLHFHLTSKPWDWGPTRMVVSLSVDGAIHGRQIPDSFLGVLYSNFFLCFVWRKRSCKACICLDLFYDDLWSPNVTIRIRNNKNACFCFCDTLLNIKNAKITSWSMQEPSGFHT